MRVITQYTNTASRGPGNHYMLTPGSRPMFFKPKMGSKQSNVDPTLSTIVFKKLFATQTNCQKHWTIC
jgi:hypothetical protein